MKKKIIFIATAICIFALSGCSKKEYEEWQDYEASLGTIDTTDTSFNNKEEIIESETTIFNESISISENDEENNSRIIELVENNISEEFILNKITIKETEYLLPASAADIKDIVHCSYATAYCDTQDFFFEGQGWGIQSDPKDIMSFNGTTIFFQLDDKNEKIIAAETSEFWIKEDFNPIFADIISVGMDKDAVESLLGEGYQGDDNVFYKNSTGILAIEYDGNVVDEVTIFCN